MADRGDYVGMGAVVADAADALTLDRKMCELRAGLYPSHAPSLCLRGTEIYSGTMGGLGGAVPVPYGAVFDRFVGMMEGAGVGVVHVGLRKIDYAKATGAAPW